MTRAQRLVLIVSILASFVAFLDGSVVNVILPALARDFGGGLALQQWVVDGYLLTLGSLILLAGSLADGFGQRRVLTWGLIGFGTSSLLCAVAPNGEILILARLLQGAAGALLVPSSLAIIIRAFSGAAQGQAIGIWTAWTGMAFVLGPLLGGWLVDVASWRWVFAINLVPVAITLVLIGRIHLEQTAVTSWRPDWLGALLCTGGLAATVYALIELPVVGWQAGWLHMLLGLGIVSLGIFGWYERRVSQPMLPLQLFRVRNFWVGNVATVAIYGGLTVATFLLTLYLQQVAGYSALAAGSALLPIPVIMFGLSSRVGGLAGTYGPRWFMAGGPLVAAVGFGLLSRIQNEAVYVSDVLPGVLVFAVGLALTVSPLTTAVLADIGAARAGVGSAVNNAVSRVAGLLATAMVGLVIGSQLNQAGYARGMLATAVAMAIGGVVSAVGILNPKLSTKSQSKAPV